MEIIGASILVSVITTKILATYYFKKVDGYVKDMEPWEHGIDYPDIQKIYDSWTEEGGNQVDLFKKVVIPTLVVSGFFPEKQAQSIMEELENQ